MEPGAESLLGVRDTRNRDATTTESQMQSSPPSAATGAFAVDTLARILAVPPSEISSKLRSAASLVSSRTEHIQEDSSNAFQQQQQQQQQQQGLSARGDQSQRAPPLQLVSPRESGIQLQSSSAAQQYSSGNFVASAQPSQESSRRSERFTIVTANTGNINSTTTGIQNKASSVLDASLRKSTPEANMRAPMTPLVAGPTRRTDVSGTRPPDGSNVRSSSNFLATSSDGGKRSSGASVEVRVPGGGAITLHGVPRFLERAFSGKMKEPVSESIEDRSNVNDSSAQSPPLRAQSAANERTSLVFRRESSLVLGGGNTAGGTSTATTGYCVHASQDGPKISAENQMVVVVGVRPPGGSPRLGAGESPEDGEGIGGSARPQPSSSRFAGSFSRQPSSDVQNIRTPRTPHSPSATLFQPLPEPTVLSKQASFFSKITGGDVASVPHPRAAGNLITLSRFTAEGGGDGGGGNEDGGDSGEEDGLARTRSGWHLTVPDLATAGPGRRIARSHDAPPSYEERSDDDDGQEDHIEGSKPVPISSSIVAFRSFGHEEGVTGAGNQSRSAPVSARRSPMHGSPRESSGGAPQQQQARGLTSPRLDVPAMLSDSAGGNVVPLTLLDDTSGRDFNSTINAANQIQQGGGGGSSSKRLTSPALAPQQQDVHTADEELETKVTQKRKKKRGVSFAPQLIKQVTLVHSRENNLLLEFEYNRPIWAYVLAVISCISFGVGYCYLCLNVYPSDIEGESLDASVSIMSFVSYGVVAVLSIIFCCIFYRPSDYERESWEIVQYRRSILTSTAIGACAHLCLLLSTMCMITSVNGVAFTVLPCLSYFLHESFVQRQVHFWDLVGMILVFAGVVILAAGEVIRTDANNAFYRSLSPLLAVAGGILEAVYQSREEDLRRLFSISIQIALKLTLLVLLLGIFCFLTGAFSAPLGPAVPVLNRTNSSSMLMLLLNRPNITINTTFVPSSSSWLHLQWKSEGIYLTISTACLLVGLVLHRIAAEYFDVLTVLSWLSFCGTVILITFRIMNLPSMSDSILFSGLAAVFLGCVCLLYVGRHRRNMKLLALELPQQDAPSVEEKYE